MKRILMGCALPLVISANMATAAPVEWTVASGGNGHWYEVVTTATYNVFQNAINAAAALTYNGMTGYLATITSAEEQTFLLTVNPNNLSLWLGGSDAQQDGAWQWVTEPGGPIPFTYTNWSGGEPNNNWLTGREEALVGWKGNIATGAWNDYHDGSARYGILVEYGQSPAPVPLPASMPLLVAGLGGIAVLRRRRRAKN